MKGGKKGGSDISDSNTVNSAGFLSATCVDAEQFCLHESPNPAKHSLCTTVEIQDHEVQLSQITDFHSSISMQEQCWRVELNAIDTNLPQLEMIETPEMNGNSIQPRSHDICDDESNVGTVASDNAIAPKQQSSSSKWSLWKVLSAPVRSSPAMTSGLDSEIVQMPEGFAAIPQLSSMHCVRRGEMQPQKEGTALLSPRDGVEVSAEYTPSTQKDVSDPEGHPIETAGLPSLVDDESKCSHELSSATESDDYQSESPPGNHENCNQQPTGSTPPSDCLLLNLRTEKQKSRWSIFPTRNKRRGNMVQSKQNDVVGRYTVPESRDDLIAAWNTNPSTMCDSAKQPVTQEHEENKPETCTPFDCTIAADDLATKPEVQSTSVSHDAKDATTLHSDFSPCSHAKAQHATVADLAKEREISGNLNLAIEATAVKRGQVCVAGELICTENDKLDVRRLKVFSKKSKLKNEDSASLGESELMGDHISVLKKNERGNRKADTSSPHHCMENKDANTALSTKPNQYEWDTYLADISVEKSLRSFSKSYSFENTTAPYRVLEEKRSDDTSTQTDMTEYSMEQWRDSLCIQDLEEEWEISCQNLDDHGDAVEVCAPRKRGLVCFERAPFGSYHTSRDSHRGWMHMNRERQGYITTDQLKDKASFESLCLTSNDGISQGLSGDRECHQIENVSDLHDKLTPETVRCRLVEKTEIEMCVKSQTTNIFDNSVSKSRVAKVSDADPPPTPKKKVLHGAKTPSTQIETLYQKCAENANKSSATKTRKPRSKRNDSIKKSTSETARTSENAEALSVRSRRPIIKSLQGDAAPGDESLTADPRLLDPAKYRSVSKLNEKTLRLRSHRVPSSSVAAPVQAKPTSVSSYLASKSMA